MAKCNGCGTERDQDDLWEYAGKLWCDACAGKMGLLGGPIQPPTTVEEVAAAALAKKSRLDRERELAGLLRQALARVQPWCRQSWMAEEDKGVRELAHLLLDMGVSVETSGQKPQKEE